MALSGTSRPFAYNPTASPISGTTEFGEFVLGNVDVDYSSDYGGLKWWGGPEESEILGYIIGNTRPGGQPTPSGVVGTANVGFWRSKFHTDESFLQLANYIGYKNGHAPFVNTNDAEIWLESNGYYTSFNLPTPTPTSTSVPTTTPTPTVTQTPTVTPSQTVTLTPSITPSQTNTPTPSITASQTNTPTPSITASQTNTPTPSITASQTVTPTVTRTPTNTPTKTPTQTNTPSVTPSTPIGVTFSQTFTSGQAPGQQLKMLGQPSELPLTGSYTTFVFSSSLPGSTVYTVTDGVKVQTLATNLKNGTAVSVTIGANNWLVGCCACRAGGINPNAVEFSNVGSCDGASTRGFETMDWKRNWGGIGSTVGAATQTLTLTFS